MKKITVSSSILAAALLGAVSVNAYAQSNPFAVQVLDGGYSTQVAAAEKHTEGGCGEAKCGAKPAVKTKHEGNCGAAKATEGKCGGDDKVKEGACGAESKAAEGACSSDKKRS